MIGRIVTKISRYEIEGWLHIPLNACGENTHRPKETRQWHDQKNPNSTPGVPACGDLHSK
jgi:hypothetical protein